MLNDQVGSALEILIVEDDPNVRSSLQELLEEEGYIVEAVVSGTDAIALSAERRFDLVITDIKTPGTDGLSALASVKEDNPEVAGIVITGYSTEEYATRAAKLQVENYLKKPFDVNELLRTVEALAERKRAAEQKLVRELAVYHCLNWLAGHLIESRTERDFEEVEPHLRRSASGFSEMVYDIREEEALKTLMGLGIVRETGLEWPADVPSLFPRRVQQLLKAGGRTGLSEYLKESAARFLAGVAQAPDDDETESLELLSGGLLNLALSLESAGRFEAAETAFNNLLKSARVAADSYHAYFGLARVARQTGKVEEMASFLQHGAAEAEKMGPLTHSQALTERSLMLATAGRSDARPALEEAMNLARELKDVDSFALLSLANQHFFGIVAARRERLLQHLSQPETFPVVGEASPWLLQHLLSSREKTEVEHRLSQKLARAYPASLERAVRRIQNPQHLASALPYLQSLDDARKERVRSHLATLEDPELARTMERWLSANQEAPETPPIRIFSFSGLRMYRADEALELRRKKPLLLLLYLLCKNGSAGEEQLYDTFWPGDVQRARASIRTTLSYLRKLLCPDGKLDPLLRHADAVYLAEEVPVWFDLREYDRLVKRGQSLEETATERAMECYRAAVRLYRGEFLENFYEEWVLEIRNQAELQYGHLLNRLINHASASGNWGQALEYSARGLRRDPINTDHCEVAMRSLVELRRSKDALDMFEESARALKEDELEPTIEMLKLREMAKLGL